MSSGLISRALKYGLQHYKKVGRERESGTRDYTLKLSTLFKLATISEGTVRLLCGLFFWQ